MKVYQRKDRYCKIFHLGLLDLVAMLATAPVIMTIVCFSSQDESAYVKWLYKFRNIEITMHSMLLLVSRPFSIFCVIIVDRYNLLYYLLVFHF